MFEIQFFFLRIRDLRDFLSILVKFQRKILTVVVVIEISSFLRKVTFEYAAKGTEFQVFSDMSFERPLKIRNIAVLLIKISVYSFVPPIIAI